MRGQVPGSQIGIQSGLLGVEALLGDSRPQLAAQKATWAAGRPACYGFPARIAAGWAHRD